MFCMLIIMNINIQGFLSIIVAKGDDFKKHAFGLKHRPKNQQQQKHHRVYNYKTRMLVIIRN